MKSFIYKHSIIILFFQGAQTKAYKNIYLMLAAGIEPAKPQQAKKGADCTPLILAKIYLFASCYKAIKKLLCLFFAVKTAAKLRKATAPTHTPHISIPPYFNIIPYRTKASRGIEPRKRANLAIILLLFLC